MSRSLAELADIDVSRLNGVGPKKLAALADAGVESIADLLTYYPRRYVDRTAQAPISELHEGDEVTVIATVKRVDTRPAGRSRRNLVTVDVGDGRSYLHCTFFNQPWRARQLEVGKEVAVFGKVGRFRGRLQMTNPVVDLLGDRTGRIVPIYPQTGDLRTWELADWISQALRRSDPVTDPLPAGWRDRLNLVERTWALSQIHAPESMPAMLAARRRLAFDELLRLQVALVMRKRATERQAVGIAHRLDGGLVGAFRARLPFPLTAAQERAIAEIQADLAKAIPMHRLLQGDVGSGKTLVAVSALLTAVQGGYQGAFMAPTEVLAEQHQLAVQALVAELPVPDQEGTLLEERPLRVALLTARLSASERTKVLAGLADGSIDVVIGTHALLTEHVQFRRLGLVVIDEQHRFGVEQRAALREKGAGDAAPDVLVMTATPIPRTAAMTVYGDLDTTVLDELPPGRTPITTVWARGEQAEADAWERVRAEVAGGRQAYVVCPLIEESERVEARSASEERDRLAAEVLPGLRLGLLHGQLPAVDKQTVMTEFRTGRLDVLVSTTVIEVGVDVPNATVMVIEDADRFGIAQLHQLRGRVGRGAQQSWCYLFGAGQTAEAEERLGALERSTDGFELAEVDLDLRGEGTILGTRQKGINDLKLASLRRDRELVIQARSVAFSLVDNDPTLGRLPDLAAEIRQLIDPDEAAFLFKN